MDFQFRAAGAAGHRTFHLSAPSSDPTADAGYNHPFHVPVPFSDPAAGNSRPSHLPVLSSDMATGNSRPSHLSAPFSDTAAGYFALQALRVGLAGDAAATPPNSREIQKARIRAKILAEEANQARILEEEVRRELEYERGMTERLSEVQSLGLLPPPIIPAQYLQPPQKVPAQHLLEPPLSQYLPRPTGPAQHLFLPSLSQSNGPAKHLFLPPLSQHLPQPTGPAQHLMRNAPLHHVQAPNNLSSGPICYECGEEGHLSRVCKATIEARAVHQKGKAEGKAVMASECDVTPEIHHNKPADMEKPWVDPNKTCYMCGNKGHWSRVCTASMEVRTAYKKSRTELPRKRKKCKQCGKKDHLPNACYASMEARDAYKMHKRMKARGEAAQAAASKIKEQECYKCGEMGHWSRTCKESREARAVYKKKMDEISQAAAENQV